MIHPTAIVSTDAVLGPRVSVGPFSIVHANVRLGDGCLIGSHCEIGLPTPLAADQPLVIGDRAVIRSHSVFYEGSTIGPDLTTGHRVVVREGTVAGRGFQIGTLGDVQGTCLVGDFVKLQSNVFIGKHAEVESYVWLFPFVILTNDPHPPSDLLQGVKVREFAAIAASAVILPGVEVGRGALVGANSTVTRDVPDDTIVAGSPAAVIGPTSQILLRDGSGKPAYPWRRHFHRGYPDKVVASWLMEFGQGQAPG